MINADENHFVDVNEMVLDVVYTVEIRQSSHVTRFDS